MGNTCGFSSLFLLDFRAVAVGRMLTVTFRENCQEASAATGTDLTGSGYAKHAFNLELEGRLWADSLEMVGLKDVE